MEKKELLDLIDQDSSFMKAFLDEYRQDAVSYTHLTLPTTERV